MCTAGVVRTGGAIPLRRAAGVARLGKPNSAPRSALDTEGSFAHVLQTVYRGIRAFTYHGCADFGHMIGSRIVALCSWSRPRCAALLFGSRSYVGQ